MSRRALAARLAAEIEALSKPTLLHIVATIEVHDRRAVLDGTKCRCCGSEDAEIVESILAVDLIIDLENDGKRIYRGDVSDTEWAELCSEAEHFEVPLRCSVRAKPLLLDDTSRHIFASGGNRAGKTQTGLYWLALQYLKRGGFQRRFWLVGPTKKHCLDLLDKVFFGTPSASGGLVPAILPSRLIEDMPNSARSTHATTVCGSLWEFIAYDKNPNASRGKSMPIVGAIVDEAAGLPSRSWLATLRGRCVDFKGRLWFASTATPSSFLKEEVVDKCLEWEAMDADDPRRLSGQHEGAAFLLAPLPMSDNCFVPLANVEDALRTLDHTRADVRRDFFGTWESDSPLYWSAYWKPEKHSFVHDSPDIATWSAGFLADCGAAGHVPITDHVRLRMVSRPLRNPMHATIRSTNGRWLIGQDVNYGAMEGCLVQISAPPDKRDSPDDWHFWVQWEVVTKKSDTDEAAARLVSIPLSKELDPRGSGRTLAGSLVIIDPTQMTEVDSHQRKHHQSGSVVDIFARHGLDCRAPMYRWSETANKYQRVIPKRKPVFEVFRRLLSEDRLHVATRCGALDRAFRTQLSDTTSKAGDGCPLDGRSGKWDQIMGSVDALKGVLYGAMNSLAQPAARVWSD